MTFDPAASNEPPLHPAGATLREGRYRLRDPEGCVHAVIGGQLRLRAASLPEDSTGPGRG